MRRWRLTVTGVVTALLLIGTGVPAAAEEGTATEDVLFEVVVPASAVPDPFRTLYFEAQTVDPGADAIVGAAAENMTGRAIYVDTGELLIEPVTDAFLWRQEATFGSDPDEVPAGAPVRLAAGDLILLPTIPDTEAVGDAALRIANPGSEMAVTYGFHLCGGGGSPAWPEGMGHIPPAGGVSFPGGHLAPLASAEAVVRLSRTTLEPGATTGLDDDVLFGLGRLESGSIDASFNDKTDGALRMRSWEPGRELPFVLGTDWELRASSHVPASMLYLSGVEVPAPAH